MQIRQRKRNCLEHTGQVATQKGISEGIFAQLWDGGLRQDFLLLAGQNLGLLPAPVRRRGGTLDLTPKKGWVRHLSASEQQVLTKLKLEGLSAKEVAQLHGNASEEAIHHRSHRITARLRKVASRLRSHAHR